MASRDHSSTLLSTWELEKLPISSVEGKGGTRHWKNGAAKMVDGVADIGKFWRNRCGGGSR